MKRLFAGLAVACFLAVYQVEIVSSQTTPPSSKTPSASKPTASARRPPASDCLPTASQLTTLAAKLKDENTDGNDFIRALDRAVGLDTVFLSQHPVSSVVSNDAIFIAVRFPYSTYRFGLIEANRKREPIAKVRVPTGIVIGVAPARIDAPDIEKLVVERDGKEIQPIYSTLKPSVLRTPIGATALLHAGELTFPCSAFAPGGRVRVIAIPRAGNNIEREIPPAELTGNAARLSGTK